MRLMNRRSIAFVGGVTLVAPAVLATIAALPLVLHDPIAAKANTYGNTDYYESTDYPQGYPPPVVTSATSPIWGSVSIAIGQRYGCTYVTAETRVTQSSPAWTQVCTSLPCPDALGRCWNRWHHGIDISLSSGTAVYSPVSGKIVAIDSYDAAVGLQDLSGHILYFVHGSLASGYALGSLVTVGSHFYNSDTAGCPGCIQGAHLHFEVHSSRIGVTGSDPGFWDDINPEQWLQYQGPHAAMVSWASPRIDLLIRGQDANIYHRFTNDDTNWAPGGPSWEPLGSDGGGAAGQPTAASWGPNRLDIFAVGYDGNLWHKWWDGSAWGGWQNLAAGGQEGCNFSVQLIGTPSAAAWNGGNLSVFARGIDGTLHHCFWNGSAWTVEDFNGYYLTGDPTVIATGGTRLDLFMLGDRGYSGQTYHQWERTPGGWDPLETLGKAPNGSNFASQPMASSYSSSGSTSIDAFATSADGDLWNRHFDGSSWSGWLADGYPGPGVIGGVGVADFLVRGFVSTSALARGADGVSYVCLGTVGASCAWSSVGGIISNDPAAISITSDEEDVIARGGPSGSAPFSVWNLHDVNDAFGSWASFLGVMA